MIKVLLVGSLPPPIGGVSTHLGRFLSLYKVTNVFRFAVLDIKKKSLFLGDTVVRNPLSVSSFFLNARVIHIHISNDYAKLFIALASKLLAKKVIYTHHNSIVKNKTIFKIMYKISDKVILVNSREINKNLIIKKKTELIPAFIPPCQFQELPKSLNYEISKFNKVISTNCFSFSLFDGNHTYGFDLVVDAFYRLSQKGQIENTLLVMVDPSATTSEFVSTLLDGKQFGTNKVLYIAENIDFSSLISKSDITIRATRTDGDSLSVRESLYLNVPIVASDATVRPKGTIIFQSDNSVDLGNKILEALGNKESFKYAQIDYGRRILALYCRVSR